nr:tropinone reductase homolog At5g06060-like [Ipomoea batatas]
MASEQCGLNQRWSLKGMTALVSGGTRGIGAAIVEELAGFGAEVYTCSRNQKELDQKVQEWQAKGFKVSGSVCDLASREQREQLIHTVSSVFNGKLNILVNNAAISKLRKAKDYEEEEFSGIIETNLESPYHLATLTYPLLKATGNASIVFISSLAGHIALPAISLTKNLACEWGKDGIRVNTVSPSGVRTTIMKPEEIEPSIAKMYGEIMMRTPLKPIAEANEISPLVAFLCLPAAASHITGQVILIDGGYTAGAFHF